jgi:predicted RecA/RadA family phage recombinase
MRNNLTPNVNRLTVTVPYADGVVAGQCIVVGPHTGVALSSAAYNETVEIAAAGLFEITKQPGLSIAEGQQVF